MEGTVVPKDDPSLLKKSTLEKNKLNYSLVYPFSAKITKSATHNFKSTFFRQTKHSKINPILLLPQISPQGQTFRASCAQKWGSRQHQGG